MAFGGGEVEGGVEAAEGGVLGEARVELEEHLGLDEIPVPGGGDQPLAGGRAPQRVPHQQQQQQRFKVGRWI